MSLLVITSLVFSACGPTPEPQVVEKTVKETVIVGGTAEVVEKVVTEIVEKVVTATPEPPEEPSGEITSSKTWTIAWTATDPPSLDPAVCNDSGCHTLVRGMYEALLGYKYGTTEIEGVLADSWEVSDDGLTWTFTLRDGITFSDGSPVTPEDVIYSFDRVSGVGKGPSFVLSGTYAGAEVIDEQTVTVKLEKSIGSFQSMLPRVFIVNKDVVTEHTTDDDPWAEEWMYDHDAGTGPFVLEKWEHGAQIAMVKNQNYWDPGWPKVERAVELLVPERATDRLLIEGGDVDTILNPVLDVLSAYEENPDITVMEAPALINMMIMMSTISPPLDDVRVRKAVALAFDYPAMVDGVYLGHAVQAQGPMARSMPMHDDTLPIYQQDLEQAAELLAEAGYPGGGFDLELLIVQGQPYGIGASQILQQGLAQIGVNLKIIEASWATLLGRTQSREDPAQMYTWYFFPAYPDPDAGLWPSFHTSQQEVGYNGTFWGNEETDELLERGRFSSDQAERERIYSELQQRIFEDHPAIWLVNPNWINVRRSWVQNYEYEPTWHQTFRPGLYVLEGKP
jgi:peptide/nickel transport system substrate-binding protein